MPATRLSDFRSSSDGIDEIDKAPHADLDYYQDWTDWLQPDETITAFQWTVPTGLTSHSEDNWGALVAISLAGGTIDQDYVVSCDITTSAARLDTRSFRVRCRQR